jgi:hypothetical protein
MDWVLHRVTTPRQTFDVPSNKISLKSIGPPQKYCHHFKDPISSICLKPQVFPTLCQVTCKSIACFVTEKKAVGKVVGRVQGKTEDTVSQIGNSQIQN